MTSADAEDFLWKGMHRELEQMVDELRLLPIDDLESVRKMDLFYESLPPLARIHATTYAAQQERAGCTVRPTNIG